MTNASDDLYDWSFFDVYMDIRAPQEAVYDAWATGGGMESFFVKTWVNTDSSGKERQPDDRAQVDDAYEASFHHPLDFAGTILEAEPPSRFAFSFASMRVSVDLMTFGVFTRIHLRQNDISIEPKDMVMQHMNCRSCWVYYLLNLKSVLEHGADLRDVDRSINDNIISIPFHERAIAHEIGGES